MKKYKRFNEGAADNIRAIENILMNDFNIMEDVAIEYAYRIHLNHNNKPKIKTILRRILKNKDIDKAMSLITDKV